MSLDRRHELDDLPARMRSKVVDEDGCWVWTGARNSRGYGQIHIDYRTQYAHRLAYVLAKGPIPEGREIHHECGNKACCNPNHLRALTVAEHALTRVLPHCRRGHPMEGTNVVYVHRSSGIVSRRCRECERIRQARQRGGAA